MNPRFAIRNESDDHAVIDIFGDIGESFWTESYSMKDAKRDLEAITAKKITLNISSLGGALNDALAMHDMLKLHDAEVTAKILGATASSGTVVALGADKVEMSDNALFLVHNAWTWAAGNAEELREQAADLDVWDNRLVSLYNKKTGKDENEIRDLMGEEKWIDADEAKDFGFVDAIFNGKKIEANVRKNINAMSNVLKHLPKIDNSKNDNIMNEAIENLKNEFNSIKTSILDAIKNLKPQAEEGSTENKPEVDVTALTNQLNDLETKMNELKPGDDVQALKDKVSALEAQNARLKAGETVVEDDGDDPDAGEKKKLNCWDKLAEQMLGHMPKTVANKQPSALAQARKEAGIA